MNQARQCDPVHHCAIKGKGGNFLLGLMALFIFALLATGSVARADDLGTVNVEGVVPEQRVTATPAASTGGAPSETTAAPPPTTAASPDAGNGGGTPAAPRNEALASPKGAAEYPAPRATTDVADAIVAVFRTYRAPIAVATVVTVIAAIKSLATAAGGAASAGMGTSASTGGRLVQSTRPRRR